MTDLTAIPSGDVREVASVTDDDFVLIDSSGTVARVGVPALKIELGYDNFDSIEENAAASAAAASASATAAAASASSVAARGDAQAILATAATKYGVVPSDPTDPVYVDDEMDTAMAAAVAAGEAKLYLLPGLHFFQRSIVVPAGLQLVGTGNMNAHRFGTADDAFDFIVDAPDVTTLVACGTGTKDYTIDYVTDGSHLGFVHTNANRIYTNTADQFVKLNDYTNQDAVGATPATPRAFSAFLTFEEGYHRYGLTSIRVISSCPDTDLDEVEGVGGYKRNDEIMPYADWDVGVLVSNAWNLQFEKCNIVGYWKNTGHLSYAAFLDNEDAETTPNAEHGLYDRCQFQCGVEIRSGDLYPIIDKTSDDVYMRWTPSHQFVPGGDTIRISQTDTFSSTIEYEYSACEYTSGNAPNFGANTLTTGYLILRNVRPVGAGSNDTSLIQTEHANAGECSKAVLTFSGGTSHTQFVACDLTDFAHCTGLDECSTDFNGVGLPGRPKYSTAFAVSGAPARAIKFSNCKMTTSGPVLAHIGMARDLLFDSDTYAETRPYKTTLAGSLDGERGAAIFAGSTVNFRQEVGSAGQASGRMGIGTGWNTVISIHPYRITREDTRMEDQLDHFYFHAGYVDYSLMFPRNTTYETQFKTAAGQALRISRIMEDGTEEKQFYCREVEGEQRVEINENTLHVTQSEQVRPGEDNTILLGGPSFRWEAAYAVAFRPGDGTVRWTTGAGSPEGSLTAVVGSMYTRTDGGSSTTLYIKESGTGNTGWVAK